MNNLLARSVILAMGTTIFLYSDQLISGVVIYDPLDPKNVITPVVNDDEIGGEVNIPVLTRSETDESSVRKSQNSIFIQAESKKNTFEIKVNERSVISEILRQSEKKNEVLKRKLNLPKIKDQSENRNLILDNNFFSQASKVATLPTDSGGGDGEQTNIAYIAQSAYLLSGVILYGQTKNKLDIGVSGYFAR